MKSADVVDVSLHYEDINVKDTEKWICQWTSTMSWSSRHRDEKQISSGSCFLEARVYPSLELKIYNGGRF